MIENCAIVWGGYSCMAGYIHWAYVSECKDPDPTMLDEYCDGVSMYDLSFVGKKLFEAPIRKDIDNPKNVDCGKEPNQYPKNVCEEWCKNNGWRVFKYVKMRTS